MGTVFYDQPSDYLSHLPEVIREAVEVEEIAKVVNLELDRLQNAIKQATENKSVMSAGGEGIARWESILGVTMPLNSTDKSRKEALRAKLMTKPPINLGTLREVIQAYMGVPVEILLNGYHIQVRYRGELKINDLKPLYATLYETIPAVMLISIVYLYLTWTELGSTSIDFNGLTSKGLNWNSFERAEWLLPNR